jgi:hypothetical protein
VVSRVDGAGAASPSARLRHSALTLVDAGDLARTECRVLAMGHVSRAMLL